VFEQSELEFSEKASSSEQIPLNARILCEEGFGFEANPEKFQHDKMAVGWH
jgi:hypothetical protein